jgi:hypothetical protein
MMSPDLRRRRALLRGPLRLLALALGVGLVAAPGPAPADDPKPASAAQPTSYHATAFVRGDIGLRVIDYWSQGANMRARTLIAGRPITTIVRGDRYIVYDGLAREGFDVERSAAAQAADRGRTRPFAIEVEEIVRDGGEKIEDVALGPLPGEVWQVTDERGRRKAWVSARPPRVPIRVQTYDRGTGADIEIDYSNWVFSLELPEAFFTAPKDVSLRRFDYDAFVQWVLDGGQVSAPVLYPDLLYGGGAPR